MSLGLSSFTTFNIKTDLDQSPLKRNMLQKQPYLRQSSLGLDAEDERKITLEGWSQSNESFLFANGEDYKQDGPEVNQQNFQKNYSKVCKNALNNLSEGLTSMHKKKQVESLVDSLLKAPSDSKPKEPIDKQDKIEKTDFDFVTQVKTNQTAYSTSFDTLDARQKQEQKSKLSSEAKTNDLHSMQGDTKGFTTVDARGFSIDMDKINEAMNGSNNNNNNNEKLDKPDKSPKLFYRPPSKSHRTPRSEILTMKDQSRNASPMTTTKLTIHVINFKTKPLPSHASILDRFKIFSKHSPKPDNQLKIKSARTVSMNLDEKDSEAFQQSSQSPSPTARYIPLSENSPKKRNPIGKARFTNSTDVGMEMRIRGFGLQEPVSPPRKTISIAEQKATLKKIFGTKRELGNNDGKNAKGQQKPIYNILEAFKMQPVSRLHASKYEGFPSKVKFARGQSMTNDISEEPKEIKAKEISVLQKTSRNAQSVSRQENSSPVGEDLEGVIQSIFDLRKTLHPIANFEPKNKKNVGKDSSTTFKNDSNIIVPAHSKDYGYSSYSKMISAGSSKRLIVRNGGPRKDSEQGKASTHRDREL